MLGPPPGISPPVDAAFASNPNLTNNAAYLAGVHAQNATQVALKLAGQVHEFYNKAKALEEQVKALERWKTEALQEVRQLREEHKEVKRAISEHLGLPGPSDSSQAPMKRTASEPLRLQAPAWSPKGVPMLEKAKTVGALDDLEKEPMLLEAPAALGDWHGDPASRPLVDPRLTLIQELAPDLDAGTEGVKVERSTDGDFDCAVWRIAHLTKRLKECMGRNIVSSPFVAWEMEDVRLMVCPEGKDSRAGRTRKQKTLYTSKVSDGPLEGGLKLKVPDCTRSLTYFFKVGDEKRGPFTHNFAEHSVSDFVSLSIDFLQKMEPDGSLTVRVEIQRPADFKGRD
mmetsp:Transcript_69885/g.167753  ORF Transcript_69885/g.167753 Transcript_69885/m.167753 type:complete len:341 (+) Transcript_69885:65-1087(+)